MILQKIMTASVMVFLANATSFAQTDDGIIRIKSPYTVTITINKLEDALRTKGMTIFNRVSHSDNAKNVSLDLRPTELLIFGNPKLGTLLMQCEQLSAIDLPMKALAYEDEQGQVWLTYNDPAYIAYRHYIKDCKQPLQKINDAMAIFSRMATE